jgi:anti-sigma regulatory factor (Ser/Thr protein kinase)
VDEAAARLAQLQLQGASFNKQQAKDYRQAISETYDRAIEAAQRGDPKGQTALQLLRAAGPR